MSSVDSYALLTNQDEAEAILWLAERVDQKGYGFIEVGSQAGGYKSFEMDVWLLATNYLRLPEMAELLIAAPWRAPELLHIVHYDSVGGMYPEIYTLAALRDLVEEG